LTLSILVESGLTLTVILPATYPSETPPIVMMGNLKGEQLMKELFVQDEEVLLKWVESVREKHRAVVDNNNNNTKIKIKIQERKVLLLGEEETTTHEEIKTTIQQETELDASTFYTGLTITANKSKFVAHASRCRTQEDAKRLIKMVQQSKFGRATHNIWAYRLSNGRADNDDDGESAAGGRLSELLHLIDAKDILVIVSRFYGNFRFFRVCVRWFTLID